MMYGQVNNKAGIWGFALAAVLGLSVAGFSDTARADGWYGGLGIGQSVFKDQNATCSSLGNILSSRTSCNFDLKDTGMRVFGGYQFNSYLAVELGYVDLGKMKASASGTLSGSPATGTAEFKAKSFDATAVGTFALGDAWGALARFGVHRWDVDAPASAVTNSGTITATSNPSRTGTHMAMGVGAYYDLSKQLTARGEMIRYRNVGDQLSTGESFSVDLFSVSLVYRF